MKYNDTIQILKTVVNAIKDPMFITDKLRVSELFQFPNDRDLNNSMNNSMDNGIYVEDKSSNKEYNESVPIEASESYNDNESNGYYNKQQDTSSEPQGVIDSIALELTSVRLQQAIILSEIVGKPRSKTRKRRRF